MYKSALFIGFFLLLTPAVAWAQTPSCSAQGYTAIFVNGIWDTKLQAQADSNALWFQLGHQYNNQALSVQLGYNPTHLAGAGDLLQSTAQLFSKSISNFDLNTILLEVYPEVTTRKLMLVGHSQGAFYTNDMYDYLLAHGEPIDAVGVYNVASPAAYTAGHGKYINSSGDTLLVALRTLNFDILPNNADLVPTGTSGDWSGHAFINDYLDQAAPQILADVDSEMSALKATDASQTGDCFTPPDNNLGYKTEAAAFAVADPTATALKAGTVTVAQAGAVAFTAATKLATGALQLFSDSIIITAVPPSQVQTDAGTFKIVNKLYGSSVGNLSPQDKKDLLGSSQGSAIVLAVATDKPLAIKGGLVEGTSTVATTTLPAAPKSIFPASSNGPVWGGGAGAGQPVAAVNDTTVETTTTDDTITTVDTSASTTPPVVDEPPAPVVPPPPTGAPVVDNFDSYNGSTWATWPSFNNSLYALFGIDNGTPDPYGTDPTITNDCHSGGCVIANNSLGSLGTFGHTIIMYQETGVGQDQGAFTLWARARKGLPGGSVAANVALCLGQSLGCTPPNLYYPVPDFAAKDNIWHQYYFAWRQGSASVETCEMFDDINASDCVWQSTNVVLGTQVDGVLLNGNVIRVDLGDQVWFDDLENAPQ
jgi:hypothetical protein